ncbi:MAG TPA: hypothetical protein VK735_42120 [Pseudonocardia sp.]|uniref:hypothetical protein n=1 Tax=Pseudonocardia sp. TaxID=60912 RepID=UPI002CCB860E|nr:hypothetical protein [Pseudonocardia sp.]HTF54086.1 hypothetical protein [Pseudonocardia sp.]
MTRAFQAAGLCKEDNSITFPQPICRDGDGWLAVVDLPYGKKAADALKKHQDIAAALDIDEVQVFLDRIRARVVRPDGSRCGWLTWTCLPRSQRSPRWPRPSRSTSGKASGSARMPASDQCS